MAPSSRALKTPGTLKVLTALQPLPSGAGTIPARWTLPPQLEILYLW